MNFRAFFLIFSLFALFSCEGLRRTRQRSLKDAVLSLQQEQAGPQVDERFWGPFSPTNYNVTLFPFCKQLFWQDTGAGSTIINLDKQYPADVALDRLANFPGSCDGPCPCSGLPVCVLTVTNLGNFTMQFDATGSLAPVSGVNISDFIYDPGDGSGLIINTGFPPVIYFATHQYLSVGDYNVSLTVVETDNSTCFISVPISLTNCSTGLPGTCDVGVALDFGYCTQTVYPVTEVCSDQITDWDCDGFPGCEDMDCFLDVNCLNSTTELCFDDYVPPCNETFCIGLFRQCYTGPFGTLGVGVCSAGTETCLSNLTASGCVGEVVPAPMESCDPFTDLDCDGDPLNGYPLYGTSCASNVTDMCIPPALYVCNLFQNDTECSIAAVNCSALLAGSFCNNGVCECPVGTLDCGGGFCQDILFDLNNCGACNVSVDDNLECTLDSCFGGVIVNDPSFFAGGPCNGGNGTCSGNGTCCLAGTADCGLGYCQDILFDFFNCGACNVSVDDNLECTLDSCFGGVVVNDPSFFAGGPCSNGTGTCSGNGTCCLSGTADCGLGYCQDILSDPNNCGACNVTVDDGLECTLDFCSGGFSFNNATYFAGTACNNNNGTCSGNGSCCVNGTYDCGSGFCVTLIDDFNCGACNNSCEAFFSGSLCFPSFGTGICLCPANTTACATSCINLNASDPLNCGACNATIDDGNECTIDSCNGNVIVNNATAANGNSCNNGTGTCNSGVCQLPVSLLNKATVFQTPNSTMNIHFAITSTFAFNTTTNASIYDYFGFRRFYDYDAFGISVQAFFLPYLVIATGNCTANPKWGNVTAYGGAFSPTIADDDTYETYSAFFIDEPVAFLTPGLLNGSCTVDIYATPPVDDEYPFDTYQVGVDPRGVAGCIPRFGNTTQETNEARIIANNQTLAISTSQFTRCPMDSVAPISFLPGPPGPLTIDIIFDYVYFQMVDPIVSLLAFQSVEPSIGSCATVSSTNAACAQGPAGPNVNTRVTLSLGAATPCRVVQRCAFLFSPADQVNTTVPTRLITQNLRVPTWQTTFGAQSPAIRYYDGTSSSFSFNTTVGVFTTGPSCADTIQNQDETDTDCGGSICLPCASTQSCLVDDDCISRSCVSLVCA